MFDVYNLLHLFFLRDKFFNNRLNFCICSGRDWAEITGHSRIYMYALNASVWPIALLCRAAEMQVVVEQRIMLVLPAFETNATQSATAATAGTALLIIVSYIPPSPFYLKLSFAIIRPRHPKWISKCCVGLVNIRACPCQSRPC